MAIFEASNEALGVSNETLEVKSLAHEFKSSILQKENARLVQEIKELREQISNRDASTPVMSQSGDIDDNESVYNKATAPVESVDNGLPPLIVPANETSNQTCKDIQSLLSAHVIANLMQVGTIVKCVTNSKDGTHGLLHNKVGVVLETREGLDRFGGRCVEMFRVQFLTGVTGTVCASTETKRLEYQSDVTRKCVDFSVTDSPEFVCMLRVISRHVPTEGESEQATTSSAYAREVMERFWCKSDAADTMALLFIDLCTHAENASILTTPQLATVLNPCQMEIVSALAKFQTYDQGTGVDWKQFRKLKRHAHPDRASSWGNYAKQRGWLTEAQVALVVQTMTSTFQAIMERKKQAQKSPSGGMFSGGLF